MPVALTEAERLIAPMDPNMQRFNARAVQARGLDPFPWYAQMRAASPMWYAAEFDAWFAFGYDDVLALVNDPHTFSSQRGISVGEQGRRRGSILSSDPPRHNQLRALVSQAFTPRAIEQMATEIQRIVNELLDAVADAGRMDVIVDLAYPLPVTVIADMLGVPVDLRATFKAWSDQVVSPSLAEAAMGGLALEAYFRGEIARRRAAADHPGDLVDRLLHASIDGEPLGDDDIVDFCTLLLVAGNETTTNLIGNALWTFDEHPAVMDELRAEPALLPGAIEEVLRFRSPVQRLSRRALMETTLGGQALPAGTLVFGWLGSANRDETIFPNAATFDIHRDAQRNLAFGHGIHACLGAPLAKLETQIALATVLARLRALQRDTSQPLAPTPSFFALGLQHLAMTFTVA
jgi:cytochrome P450